jgi:hypothetical protein
MAGVLGRWGDGSDLPLVLDIIRTLHAQASRTRGGLVAWLEIRSYPAVLVFTAYGLGLTRAERWVTLHELLTSHISRQDREPERTVDSLFLWAWAGGNKDYWKHIEGLERRIIPLSDHLFSFFSEQIKSFAGVTPDFELMYAHFELLGSLAHLEKYGDSDIESALAVAASHQNSMWMPVGRVGWDTANCERLVREIQSEPMKTALLKAGFARGSGRFLELFLLNLGRIAERMRWW